MSEYQQELTEIRKMLKRNQRGMSVLDISEKLGVNRNSVAKYMDVLSIGGFVEMRKVGPSKLYYLTNRIPANSIMDSSTDVIVQVDNGGYIPLVNQTAKKFFGDIKSVRQITEDEEFHSALEKRKTCEVMIKSSWIRFRFFESTFEDGTPGVTLMGENITVEKNLQERNDLLNRAIESSSCGITIADATKEDFPLIYVNPGFEDMTGYMHSDIIGKNCRFLQGEETDQEGLRVIRKALKQGTGCVVELRNYRKDGTMFWNELRLNPVIDANENVTHYIGIQTDITAKKT